MSEKLFNEVQMALQVNDKYYVLRRFDPQKRESLENYVIPEIKKDIRKAVEDEDYEKLSTIWLRVGATVFQDNIRRYIENLLPEGYYLDTLTEELKKYKYDIDTRVLCKKFSEDFIGFIADRQDGWYIVVEDYDSYPDCFPVHAIEYNIEVV